MAVVGVNHVNVHAHDLEASARFYEDLFGLERIPNPDLGTPTVWLRMGDQQLHLSVRGGEPPFTQHFAVTVDDFATVYRRAMAMGVQDPEPFGHHVYRLPDGAVQFYVRDPAGNLVEVDFPDADALEPGLIEDLRPLRRPQTGVHATATLFLPPR
ncbi:MAG: VOC family protein [Thermoleophilia bacterium]|nr:VOC family protein [Thermoleophilia bacterium]